MNFVCEIASRQKCLKCRGSFEQDVGFRRNPRRVAGILATEFRPTCIGCEQTKRDEERHVDPFLAKARWTIRHHAEKYSMAPREFVANYGWDLERVAHLMRHAFDNTCVYCRRSYNSMLNGVRDVTMDIVDPARPPHLETNTTPCCQTCNSENAICRPIYGRGSYDFGVSGKNTKGRLSRNQFNWHWN